MRHFRDFVFQAECAVVISGNVEKSLEIAAVRFQGRFEFRERGRSFADRLGLVGDAMLGKPLEGVAACTAVFVDVNGAHAWKLACA